MDYGKEQERLLRLFEEESSGEDYDDEEETGEDYIEERSEASDTEQEFDENEDEEINANEPYFMGRDKRTKWSKHCPPKNVRTRNENLTLYLPGAKARVKENTPIGIWECFFDNEILNNIVNFTNIEIQKETEKFSRYRDIYPTNLDEVRALIGLSGIEVFRLTMSLRRFRTLLRFIRFDDIETRQERVALDKLAPIRTLFDHFNENLKNSYNHSDYVTVDEKLEDFRGRCGFRQYIPNKPNRYGIKIFAVSDAKMFYTSQMEVYVGQQPNGPYKIDTKAKAVVQRLCQHIFKTNRNITTNN
ncbi:hypothetical protein NQ318_018201 [Aromia moschata]|uniref:PiggyBac transposable element-derived protein domain-containing protein n=1 Tax=Aromia moschata TaxID=1265417 RepID=A0AAV8ZDS9_9CUCU|nr:hypothetical protein NQ318_018201 [Aromia moschata]